MTFFNFIIQSMLISLSGVTAPGPMTAAIVGLGSRNPRAGIMVAVGHGIVEFPLMAAIYFGLGHFMGRPPVKTAIGIMGGIFLLFMAAGMLRSLKSKEHRPPPEKGTALKSGILLSAANPYFIIWWAVVGGALITRSMDFGIAGFAAFAVAHWFCDLLWFSLLSAAAHRGGLVLGEKFQRAVVLGCGFLLLFFGGKFIHDGVSALLTQV